MDMGRPAALALQQYWRTASSQVASGGHSALLAAALIIIFTCGASRAWVLVCGQLRYQGASLTTINLLCTVAATLVSSFAVTQSAYASYAILLPTGVRSGIIAIGA
eukprot:270355-Alexandrium_andersonii.AAC.1